MIQAAAGIYFPEVTKPCPRTSRLHYVEVSPAVPPARSLHQLLSTPRKPGASSWCLQIRMCGGLSSGATCLLFVSPAPRCLVCLHHASPALCCVPRRQHFCMTSASLPFDFLAGLCRRKYLQIRGWKEKRVFPLYPHCLAPTLAVVFSTASHQAASPRIPSSLSCALRIRRTDTSRNL